MIYTAMQAKAFFENQIAMSNEEKWDVTIHREPKTLSQNGYYWKLLELLREALSKQVTIARAELHNIMLRDYGTLKRTGGQVNTALRVDTDEMRKAIDRDEHTHLKDTNVTEERKGRTWRWYVELKGVHEMNTKEMSQLIDGLVEECRQQDIETLTWQEYRNEQKKQAMRNNTRGQASG